jgi:MFS family permease
MALLRSRGVAALFGISLANVLGTSLQIFALSVVVFQQTGSALWSSTAFAAGFLPQLLGGALLTSLADRLPRDRCWSRGRYPAPRQPS